MLETISHSSDSSVSHLFRDWQLNKSLLSKQYALPINSRREDLENIETNTESLEKELTRKSSEFRNQKASMQVTAQEVQKTITAG